MRTKSRHHIPRPDDSPSLVLENFDASGNSPDAVVYMESERLLKYQDQHYVLQDDIDEEWELEDLYLYKNPLAGNKVQLIAKFDERQMACDQIVVPDAEQKQKLAKTFKEFGAKMDIAAQQMADAVKGVNELYGSLKAEVDGVCAGFDMEDLNDRLGNKFPLLPPFRPPFKPSEFAKMETYALDIVAGCKDLVASDPFSRKRKAPDADNDE
jgi:hypothetical protein